MEKRNAQQTTAGAVAGKNSMTYAAVDETVKNLASLIKAKLEFDEFRQEILEEFHDILEKHINLEIVQVSHEICWEGLAINGQVAPNTSDTIVLLVLRQYPGCIEAQDGNLYAVRYRLNRNKENEAWAASENLVPRFPDEANADQFWVWAGARSFDEARMLLIKVAEHVKAEFPPS